MAKASKTKIILDDLSLIKGSLQEVTDGAELFSVTKIFKKLQPIFKKNSDYVNIIKVNDNLMMVSNMSSFWNFWIEIHPEFSDNIFIQWLKFALNENSYVSLPVDTMTGLKDAIKIDTIKAEITKDSFVLYTQRKIKNIVDEADDEATEVIDTPTTKKVEFIVSLSVMEYKDQNRLPTSIKAARETFVNDLKYKTDIDVNDYLNDGNEALCIRSEMEDINGVIFQSPKKFIHSIFSKQPETISVNYNTPNAYGIGKVRIVSTDNGITAYQQYSVIPITDVAE